MFKKGQFTLFIIAGVILLICLIFLLFSLNSEDIFWQDSVKEIAIDKEVKNIDLFIRNCISSVSEEALYYIGEQGGYFDLPEKSSDLGVPYYFIRTRSYLPSKQTIENELSKYIDMKLFFCIRNFRDFPQFLIEQGKINSETKIFPNYLLVNLNYPLVLKKGEKEYRLEYFNGIKVPVKIGKVYNVADQIIKDHINYNGDICLTCLSELAETNNVSINMLDYGLDEVLFVIKDFNYQMNTIPYKFIFANKYETR